MDVYVRVLTIGALAKAGRSDNAHDPVLRGQIGLLPQRDEARQGSASNDAATSSGSRSSAVVGTSAFRSSRIPRARRLSISRDQDVSQVRNIAQRPPG